VYAKEITAIEQCCANEINFHAALVTISEVHRSFNGHRGNYHLSELPDSFFGCKRDWKAGIPNPFADVFFISSDENQFTSSMTGQRTIVLRNPPKRCIQSDDPDP
jgi:hypothetical protein